jgi:hypothetical protein
MKPSFTPIRRTELPGTNPPDRAPNRQQSSQETTMVGPQQPAQIYPLGHPESGDDARFTVGLVLDVADVLAKHGYPDLVSATSGADFLHVQDVLYQFIYGPEGDKR